MELDVGSTTTELNFFLFKDLFAKLKRSYDAHKPELIELVFSWIEKVF